MFYERFSSEYDKLKLVDAVYFINTANYIIKRCARNRSQIDENELSVLHDISERLYNSHNEIHKIISVPQFPPINYDEKIVVEAQMKQKFINRIVLINAIAVISLSIFIYCIA